MRLLKQQVQGEISHSNAQRLMMFDGNKGS
jgi:hypothetical protein